MWSLYIAATFCRQLYCVYRALLYRKTVRYWYVVTLTGNWREGECSKVKTKSSYTTITGIDSGGAVVGLVQLLNRFLSIFHIFRLTSYHSV